MKLSRPNGTLDVTDSDFKDKEQFEHAVEMLNFSKIVMTAEQQAVLGDSPFVQGRILEIGTKQDAND